MTIIATVAVCLYLIGMLLVLSVFEVEEGSSPLGYIILILFWPIVTLWISIFSMLYPDEE